MDSISVTTSVMIIVNVISVTTSVIIIVNVTLFVIRDITTFTTVITLTIFVIVTIISLLYCHRSIFVVMFTICYHLVIDVVVIVTICTDITDQHNILVFGPYHGMHQISYIINAFLALILSCSYPTFVSYPIMS